MSGNKDPFEIHEETLKQLTNYIGDYRKQVDEIFWSTISLRKYLKEDDHLKDIDIIIKDLSLMLDEKPCFDKFNNALLKNYMFHSGKRVFSKDEQTEQYENNKREQEHFEASCPKFMDGYTGFDFNDMHKLHEKLKSLPHHQHNVDEELKKFDDLENLINQNLEKPEQEKFKVTFSTLKEKLKNALHSIPISNDVDKLLQDLEEKWKHLKIIFLKM